MVLVCFVAIALPFFSDFVGLIGALGFWPATVLFPIEMYRRIHKPGKGMTLWLESLNLFCFLITVRWGERQVPHVPVATGACCSTRVPLCVDPPPQICAIAGSIQVGQECRPGLLLACVHACMPCGALPVKLRPPVKPDTTARRAPHPPTA